MRIEYPLGKLLHKTPGWVSHARVSRDGKRVAFLSHPARGDDGGGPAVVDLNGNVRIFSEDWSSARGLAWSPDGSDIIFTAFRAGVGRSIYRISLDGEERPILEVPGHMTLQDVSPLGAALLVLENERMRMQFLAAGESTPRDLSWLDWTLVRAISNDGAKILFDETGVGGGALHSVYLRGTDGSPAIRLGDGSAADLSPDGEWALAAVGINAEQLTLLPVGAGEGRVLINEGLTGMAARFFPDGTRLCVIAHERGHGARLYSVDAVTGTYEPFSDEGISFHEVQMAPDGTFVIAIGPDRKPAVYPVSGGSPRPVPGTDTTMRAVGISEDGKGLFVFRRGEMPAKVVRIDIATGEPSLLRELSPPDPTGVESITSVKITRAADGIAYSYAQRMNDLYVVEGLF